MDRTLHDLQSAVREFNARRGWHRLHNPRDLLLSLVAEVGELAELVAFRPPLDPAPRRKLEDEVADVFIYLASLAESCEIRLDRAVERKLEENEGRFPVDGGR